MDALVLSFGAMWLLSVLLVFITVGGMVFWVFMLLDAVQRKNWKDDNEKLLWILILLLTNWIGAVLYFFTLRQKLGKASHSSPHYSAK